VIGQRLRIAVSSVALGLLLVPAGVFAAPPPGSHGPDGPRPPHCSAPRQAPGTKRSDPCEPHGPGRHPIAPRIVAANAVTGGVALSWTRAPGASAYQILEAVGTSTVFSPVPSADGGAVARRTRDTTVTGLTSGQTYTFEVEALDHHGRTATSAASSAIAFGPAVPADVTAAEVAGGVAVSWTPSSGAATYEVLEAANGASGYATVATLAASADTATVTGLTPGSAYTFEVVAVDALQNATTSAPTGTVTYVTAPTSVTATEVGGGVQVSWGGDTSPSGYQVLESTGAGFSAVGSAVGAGATSTTVTGLVGGDSYAFEVEALGSGTADATSAPTAAAVFGVPAPTGIQAFQTAGGVQVTWSAVAGAATYEVLEASAGSSDYVQVAVADGGGTLPSGAASATITGLTGGTAYTFEVEALDSEGNGSVSPASAALTYVTAPTAVTASEVLGGVQVSWAGDTSPTGYQVLVSNGQGYAPIGSPVAAGGTSTTVTGLAAGASYTFEVEALGAGSATPTSTASASVQYGVTTPAGVTATEAAGGIQVTWGAVAGASGYEVLDAPAGSSTYTQVAASNGGGTLAAGASSTLVTGLAAGDQYTFEVEALDAAGNDSVSPATPAVAYGAGASAALTAPAAATGQIVLNGVQTTDNAQITVTFTSAVAANASLYLCDPNWNSGHCAGFGTYGDAAQTATVLARSVTGTDPNITATVSGDSITFTAVGADAGAAGTHVSMGSYIYSTVQIPGSNPNSPPSPVPFSLPTAANAQITVTFTSAVAANANLYLCDPNWNSGHCAGFGTYGDAAQTATVLARSVTGTDPNITATVSGDSVTFTAVGADAGAAGTHVSMGSYIYSTVQIPGSNPNSPPSPVAFSAPAGDSVTIGTTTFTASASPTGNQYDSPATLASAINAAGIGVTASTTATGATGTVMLTAGAPGATGNAIALATNDPADVGLSATSLTGGTEGSVVLTFTQAMATSADVLGGLALAGGATFGTGATGSFDASGEVYTITLGSGATLASGDAIDLSAWVDAAGNPVAGPVTIP